VPALVRVIHVVVAGEHMNWAAIIALHLHFCSFKTISCHRVRIRVEKRLRSVPCFGAVTFSALSKNVLANEIRIDVVDWVGAVILCKFWGPPCLDYVTVCRITLPVDLIADPEGLCDRSWGIFRFYLLIYGKGSSKETELIGLFIRVLLNISPVLLAVAAAKRRLDLFTCELCLELKGRIENVGCAIQNVSWHKITAREDFFCRWVNWFNHYLLLYLLKIKLNSKN